MDVEKLITLVKTEFPNDALEIQECLDLLNQSIAGSVVSLKNAMSVAIDARQYAKMTELQSMLQGIDELCKQLDYYSSLLQVDVEIEEQLLEQENLDDAVVKTLPDYESLRVDEYIPYTLYDDYTYKRPAAFELFGERYDGREWKEVFVKTCEVLFAKDAAVFKSFVGDRSMQGRKSDYFTKDAKSIRAPRQIQGTDIYVMTNMSANQVRNIVEKMLRKYGIKIRDYKIYLRADYTARHVE